MTQSQATERCRSQEPAGKNPSESQTALQQEVRSFFFQLDAPVETTQCSVVNRHTCHLQATTGTNQPRQRQEVARLVFYTLQPYFLPRRAFGSASIERVLSKSLTLLRACRAKSRPPSSHVVYRQWFLELPLNTGLVARVGPSHRLTRARPNRLFFLYLPGTTKHAGRSACWAQATA